MTERLHQWQNIGTVSFLQGHQNLTYKKMSMVFVIYCYSSDISLAKYKNSDSSCKIEVAT
jgi:hypothetical protein